MCVLLFEFETWPVIRASVGDVGGMLLLLLLLLMQHYPEEKMVNVYFWNNNEKNAPSRSGQWFKRGTWVEELVLLYII